MVRAPRKTTFTASLLGSYKVSFHIVELYGSRTDENHLYRLFTRFLHSFFLDGWTI